MVGAVALSQAPLTSYASDHLDGATIAMTANRMADVNDLYAWMTTDAAKVNLALTFSPADDGTRSFGPSVVYAFHLTSRSMYGVPGMESKIICKFASDTEGECWVTNPSGDTVDYVKGDFSDTAGKTSGSGKFRVFAGRRSDPFFFNFGGFATARLGAELKCNNSATTPGACPGVLHTDAAGCLDQLDAVTAGGLRAAIANPPSTNNPAGTPCAMGQVDCFKNFNVMAIVIQVDKTLVDQGSNTLVSAWASTHAGS